MVTLALSPFDSEELVERFIRYCKIDTQSQRGVGGTVPSTSKQFELARILENELKHIGIDAETSEFCVVYASIPSNVEHTTETIGFFAHLDTSPDAPASPVHPVIHKKITGEDINLCDGVTIPTKDLMMYKGQDIISSDGHTLLGADDKAGVAALMQFATIIQRNKEIKHGNIKICFTPDEEIMNGIDKVDLQKLGCDFAYTMDGARIGMIDDETFTAKECAITIEGHEMHPGHAYGRLVNASRIAGDLLSLLPKNLTPETTQD
ncbi:MAG: putative Peptidase T, partial [Streblomastix strix]